jgi:hypothetical protein
MVTEDQPRRGKEKPPQESRPSQSFPLQRSHISLIVPNGLPNRNHNARAASIAIPIPLRNHESPLRNQSITV